MPGLIRCSESPSPTSTEEQHSTIIRALELRLLRCSISPSSSPPPYPTTTTNSSLHLRFAESVVDLIETGDYIGALSSQPARLIFQFPYPNDFHNSLESANQFYLKSEENIHSFLNSGENPSCKALLLMSIAVAAFLAFNQNNITGPCKDFPSSPFTFGAQKDTGKEWDVWARTQLMFTGADVFGKFSLLQYIVYAKMMLTNIKDNSSFTGLKSVSWWLSRIVHMQQRILDDHTSSLFDSLQILKAEMLNCFGKVENVASYWDTLLCEGEASTIVSMAHLEAGIMEYTYGRVDQSRHHFGTAEEASGLQLSVTGVLGFRTLHQVEAKAQRVLVASTTVPSIFELQTNVSRFGDYKSGSHSHEIHEASDILMTPKLLDSKKDAGMGSCSTQNGGTTSIPLAAIQQAVILARCLIIEKSGGDDELQRWDMSPFIEAVDAQEFSHFMIQCLCDILRARWESTRSRTKERALLMMEKKVQSVYESSPETVERIPYSFGVYVPTIPALRKEYGELLVRCGLIGDALKIFEDLELWDNLIICYCLLEKKAAAVEYINARLREVPNDPSLWCSLGDVTNSDACYQKALEVSNNRSTRAKRSLARSAYSRGDYATSKVLWESALASNSLYPDGWFAFGAAALKDGDKEKALEGFTRAVQLDPDMWEAWNDIAVLHRMKNKNKEAFIAFKEALKFRRNNWHMWENFSECAFDIGNFDQALEAAEMVMKLTNNKRTNAVLLEKIMIETESRISKCDQSPDVSGDPNCVVQNDHDSFGDSVMELKYEDSNLAWSHDTERLVELLGKVLLQSVRSGVGEDIWGLYARWHKIKGDLTMCSEALLKQVRSYQGADLWSNRDRFKKFARASMQLCEAYMEIALSTGSCRELYAAEMHLKNTVKQAVNFSELEEFKALQSCLEEVRGKLHTTSILSAGTP